MKQTGALINLLLLTLCTTLASAQQTHITFAYNRAWLTFTGIDNWEFKPVQVGDKFGFSTGPATGAWGITKPSGEVEISPLFDKVCRFEKGFAAVKNRGYWGVINTSAEYVVEPDFDKVWSPQNNKDTEELVMRFSGDGVTGSALAYEGEI
ncbi:MAG TPA: WG repeat-containing protein, partial [Candidatus Rifleibacterium sp.]|nr:WG repeat-containing protein [Candidatus Rifleibacterium sp.]